MSIKSRPRWWSMFQFWCELSHWSQEVFGRDDQRGPGGPLLHLAKEVKECLDDPNSKEEYADLVFLAFDAARRAGLTYSDLLDNIYSKLQKNRERKWPAQTPENREEAIEHIREDGAVNTIKRPVE